MSVLVLLVWREWSRSIGFVFGGYLLLEVILSRGAHAYKRMFRLR